MVDETNFETTFPPHISLTEYVERNHRDIDLEQVSKDTQVIAFGERHSDVLPKEFLREHLRSLRQLGFTHLALEMVESSKQNLIDNYRSSDLARNHLQLYLRANWYGRMGDYYFSLIDEATKAGITVMGMDLPKEDQDQITDTRKRLRERDRHMAGKVKMVLDTRPQARVIIFAGAGHVEKGTENSMAGILSSENVKIVSVSIIEPKKPIPSIDKTRYMYRGAAGNKVFKSLLQPTEWVISLWDPDRAIIDSLETGKKSELDPIKKLLENK